MTDSEEKRSAGRYPTHCTVELYPGIGTTRNLSTTGVCFTTDMNIESNTMLRCVIPMQKPGKNTIRLRCEGRVVRSEKSEQGYEVAMHFTTFEW